MRCRNTKTWTFLSLVGAFLDLTITFLVLFCSFITFLTSKLLSLFYLDLPCPCCSGLFSAGGDKCPLASGPVTTIRFVQNAAKRRPPFDSMWVAERDESCGSSHFLGRQNSSPTPSVTRRFSISNNKRFDVDGCSEDGEKVRMLERAKKIVSANSDVTGRQENWIDEEQEDEEDETSEMLHEIFESSTEAPTRNLAADSQHPPAIHMNEKSDYRWNHHQSQIDFKKIPFLYSDCRSY